jgi:N-acetylneuraminate synthase/N,N'-diacetyllegionaminate synthase
MNIAGRAIAPGLPAYVIAEIGVNHDGDADRAIGLVDAAADAKADAVKFQFFRATELMGRAALLAAYQERAGEVDPIAMLRRLELSADELRPAVERAHHRGLHAIVTIFSLSLVQDALSLPWDALKTASPDLVHKPLLNALAATGLPLIVSTGAADEAEVARAVRWLEPAHARLALLQCVSCYPTKADDASLEAMGALARLFPGPIGYSDHTSGVDTGHTAALMGATLLEKHLTLERTAPGPDHAASLEPPAFGAYARRARDAARLRRENPDYAAKIDATLNGSVKSVLPCELDVRRASRQSLTTTRVIAPGERLAPGDLTFKRPGTGLLPFELDAALGRATARAIPADTPLTAADLAP